ncbi:MAG: prepilin-type N-terminal cleavage/methylation domain-containing protein [Fibrella sp.]|nr:prepilin-type N-terminal cleavage/methylation domain-containing protein [Armatimonadota bacterium]
MKSLKNNANRAFTLVEIMIVVLIIGILLAIAVPNFIRAREQSRAKSCSANLKQIDSAKQQWAMDKRLAGTSSTEATLDADVDKGLVGPSLYIKAVPECPSSGTYKVNTIALDPTCSANTDPNYKHTFNGQ